MYTNYFIIELFMIGVNIGSLVANFSNNLSNFGSYSHPGKECDTDGDSECTFGVFQMYTTYFIIELFMIGVNIGSLVANFSNNLSNFGSRMNDTCIICKL